MIDIHCHILYGLDDGADDLEESVEMARIAYKDGIRHIFATPHFNKSFINRREVVEKRTASLQETLDLYQIPVKVYPGNEVRLESPEFVYEHAKNEAFAYLQGKQKFVLLEQRWKGFEKRSADIIQWFLQREIQPIIPHPERHFFFRDDPKRLTSLIESGAWTQISADSLIGKNGKEAAQFCRMLAEGDFIHTLATDAHNVRRRPHLSNGYKRIKEWCGERRVEEIRERMEMFVVD